MLIKRGPNLELSGSYLISRLTLLVVLTVGGRNGWGGGFTDSSQDESSIRLREDCKNVLVYTRNLCVEKDNLSRVLSTEPPSTFKDSSETGNGIIGDSHYSPDIFGFFGRQSRRG